MKIPKTDRLKRKAFKYNRKAFRKIVIGYIKNIGKVIESDAKEGKLQYLRTFKEGANHDYEVFLAFRWYRRFSKLNVEIVESTRLFNGKRYIEEMLVRIKWF